MAINLNTNTSISIRLMISIIGAVVALSGIYYREQANADAIEGLSRASGVQVQILDRLARIEEIVKHIEKER